MVHASISLSGILVVNWILYKFVTNFTNKSTFCFCFVTYRIEIVHKAFSIGFGRQRTTEQDPSTLLEVKLILKNMQMLRK